MASNCCALLAALPLLTPLLSYPNSTTYTSTLKAYTTIQESALHPSCFLTPTTPSQISAAVSILSSSPSCDFAIKGHAHMPAAGFANIANGVTIDMTGLNSVEVVDGGKVVRVGGGAKWLDVYAFLDRYDLAVAGGRNGDVGVGGLLLGGGISYFGPRVGWACDGVVNFEIVLSTGKIINANSTSHASLHRALKGGGNNFGIITRFDLLTLPFPKASLISGTIKTPISQKEAIFDAFVNIANAKNYDVYASLVLGMTFASPGGEWEVSTAAIYTDIGDQAVGETVETPEVYDELAGVEGTNASFVVQRLSVLSNESVLPQLNWIFFTSTYTATSASLLLSIFNSFNSTISTFTLPQGLTWSLAFEPLPTVMTQFGTPPSPSSSSGNVLGTTPSSDGNSVVILLAAIWPSDPATDAQTNEQVTAVTQKMIDNAKEIAREFDCGEGGGLKAFQYMNYADPSQDPIGSYGAANQEFLKKVAGRYDPRGVFSSGRQVKGGFKLF